MGFFTLVLQDNERKQKRRFQKWLTHIDIKMGKGSKHYGAGKNVVERKGRAWIQLLQFDTVLE